MEPDRTILYDPIGKVMKPAPELTSILSSAYRCSAFDSICGGMTWCPELGHVPRGYTGAIGAISDVQLVICLAEPGNPGKGECYPFSTPDDFIQSIVEAVAAAIKKGGRGFHGNLKYVLNVCWPGRATDEQLKLTWITEATLCSAKTSTGSIPKGVELECASRYLKKQIDLLRGAFVLALGSKAANRLRLAGIPFNHEARAVGKPIGVRAEAEKSWQEAGDAFRKYLHDQNAPNKVPHPVVAHL